MSKKLSLRSAVKNKRGGLEISVNSVVILIFAITILSLGLMFITKVFKPMPEHIINVEKQVKEEMLKQLESSTERLVLSTRELELSHGRKGKMYFALRNDLDKEVTFEILGNGHLSESGGWDGKGSTIMCYSVLGEDNNLKMPEFRTLKSISLMKGESDVTLVEVRVPSSVPKDTLYYCGMVVADPESGGIYAQEKFMIKVT